MRKLLNEHELQATATFFKILSDPTRIKIINLLNNGPLTVNEISEAIMMEQSAVSHQLRLLKSTNIVAYTEVGRHRQYRLSDNHIYFIFRQAVEHIEELL